MTAVLELLGRGDGVASTNEGRLRSVGCELLRTPSSKAHGEHAVCKACSDWNRNSLRTIQKRLHERAKPENCTLCEVDDVGAGKFAFYATKKQRAPTISLTPVCTVAFMIIVLL